MKIKKIIVTAIAVVVLIGGAGLGFMSWHNHQMQTLRSEMIAQQEANDALQNAINELADDYDIKINDDSTFKTVVNNLKSKFDKYFQREHYVLDAKEVTSKIEEISELATIEYQYECVGYVEGSANFSVGKYDTGVKNPLKDKFLVCKGWGKIKAGIDLSQVKIECDPQKKIVNVIMPESKILSNELDENSIEDVNKQVDWLAEVTTEDQNNIRQKIKEKGEECAKKSNILETSNNRAQQVIKDLINNIQKGKGDYEVQFTTAK